MLSYLESEEVITLLSDLHGVISPIYEVYSSKRTNYMEFEAFMKFCTDFAVFPDVINKSDAYRVFMNLAFQHESVVGGYGGHEQSTFGQTRSVFDSKSSVMFSHKRSSMQQQSPMKTQTQHALDIHLFVEALAFAALHIDGQNSFLILPESQMGFEKILLLIEKMSVSEGLRRMKRQEDKIKTMGVVEKIDLMAPFRRKYASYFEMREREAHVSRSLKIKNSAFKSLIQMMDSNRSTQ